MSTRKRVVSLLPSATELLCELGGKGLLVGRSHECDFPPLPDVPVLTSQKTNFTSARDVDEQVRLALESGNGLYGIDECLLRELRPDVILTQSLCAVCSVDADLVHRIARRLDPVPNVVDLNPHSLEEVLCSLEAVGEAVDMREEALEAKMRLQNRIHAVLASTATKEPKFKNVAFIEWTDPIYVGGHWTPQLLQLVGSSQNLNPMIGKKAFVIGPEELTTNDPDAIIVCPCGLDLEKTQGMVEELEMNDWWKGLRAVESGNVALVDGNQMFNRPGPRLVDCLEWLGNWCHGKEDESNFPWKTYQPCDAQKKGSDLQVDTQAQLLLEIEEAHKSAMEAGKKLYEDPKTGFLVFTEKAALDRGYCCGRGCRHCPYGHWNVVSGQREKLQSRFSTIQMPRVLRLKPRKKATVISPEDRLKVLFWSGGKDSFLTLMNLREISAPNDKILLFTTFDSTTGQVPEQDISLEDIMNQAHSFQEDLVIIPMEGVASNDVYLREVRKGIELARNEYGFSRDQIELVFGDLHLEDIKSWRESCFEEFVCRFPLFNVSFDILRQKLFSSLQDLQGSVEISSVKVGDDVPGLKVGAQVTEDLLDRLETAGIDAFGEMGEFHTKVILPSSPIKTRTTRPPQRKPPLKPKQEGATSK